LKLLVVTPIHNEALNIVKLAEGLIASSRRPDMWVVVDDGSTDGGRSLLARVDLPFPLKVVQRVQNAGGLIGGSAFKAWQAGLDSLGSSVWDYDAVMKLDADVALPVEYLARAFEAVTSDQTLGLAGGVLVGKGNTEQNLHVPGPVKMYSRAGIQALNSLPREVGFDVMDEVAIKHVGLRVLVQKDNYFGVRRSIGASQGLVHGRRRNGRVCRWTAYYPPYFFLHALRYAFRRPYLIGSFAMIYGYSTASVGPYPLELRRAHSDEQRGKLREVARRPFSWIRETYSTKGVTN
jgi:dolichol-phosphate mannosyltransferase